MARITVRFRNGDTSEWELHESMDLGNLATVLTQATGGRGVTSFGVASESGRSTDYGFVGLAMADVISWHIDGMLDPEVAARILAELQTPPNEEPA
jgi:hypothetical protein